MNHRDYTEGHLTMLGWQPTAEGRGGATRDGVAIYTYAQGITHRTVHVAEAKRHVRGQLILDMWTMSDELFWALVHYIRGYPHEP